MEGRTKVVRERARAVLEDERLRGVEERIGDVSGSDDEEEEEFEGFTD